MPTHEVLNQPPPLEDCDPLQSDAALAEALRREGGEWAKKAFHREKLKIVRIYSRNRCRY